MATIQKLMSYLEQGYEAVEYDRIGPAYLRPVKQDDSLVFELTEHSAAGNGIKSQKTYTQEQVLRSKSKTLLSEYWGILLYGEVGEEEPERIDQAIADGRAHKAKGF